MSKIRLVGPAVAVISLVLAFFWLFGGQKSEPESQIASTNEVSKSLIPSVQVVTSLAQSVRQTLEINGVTEAKRSVVVRSEANGKVIQLLKNQGDVVRKNEAIAKVDLQDLPARLKQTEAFQEQTRLEYEGAQKLSKQGLQNEAQLAKALANYEQAKAQLASLKLQIANTDIRAPFAGQIENLSIELGSYVRQGDSIAEIYDYSQLLFVGSVSEKDIALLNIGQDATVELRNGAIVSGKVDYISSVTNPATRTFTVELTVEKSSSKVSGITSVAKVDLNNALGHYISPALLYINDAGQMGLKVLDDNNNVKFLETSIIRSDTQGVWVEGLSESENIIVVGQGFVNVNDEAKPTFVEFDADTAVGL